MWTLQSSKFLSLINCFLLLSILSGVVRAEQRAVIIGVAEYPNLSDSHDLVGPLNDAVLLETYLTARGFAPQQIKLLTDAQSKANLPTKANIFRVMDEQLAQLESGDFLYLHFSGHGSQQPAKAEDDEIDGLTEIFLPRDTKQWDGKSGTVINAITDDEIGAYLDAYKDKGIFVWLVFDSCHSGTMSRSTWQARKLPGSALGIPKTRSTSLPKKEPRVFETKNPGGFVAFFAAQTTEETPEMKLPKRSEQSEIYGLFTFQLLEALRETPNATYRQIADQIMQNYMAQPWYGSSPLFAGDDLDRKIFDGTPGNALRQWALIDSPDGWQIPVGYLHGLQTGSELLLLAKPTDVDEKALGSLQVTSVGPVVSKLQLRAEVDVPSLSYARLIDRGVELGMNISLIDDAAYPMSKKAKFVVESLPEQAGIEWVEADQAADARLVETDGSLVLLTEGEPLPCLKKSKDRCAQQQDFIKLPLAGDPKAVQTRLLKVLTKTNKALNLMRLGSVLSLDGLDTVLNVERFPGGKKEQYGKGDVPELYAGDSLSLTIANFLDVPLDITVLFVGSDYGIDVVFPRGGAFNRFMEEEERSIPLGRINTETTGQERLVVIASKARRTAAPANFSFLAQEGVQRTRNATTPLGSLLTEAGFGGLRTRSTSSESNLAGESDIHTLGWVTRRK